MRCTTSTIRTLNCPICFKRKTKISVITPSFKEEALGGVIAKTGELVNAGLIDEILMVEGSTLNGEIDYETIRVAAEAALDSLEDFDTFKVIHQSLPEICALLETNVTHGKGMHSTRELHALGGIFWFFLMQTS